MSSPEIRNHEASSDPHPAWNPIRSARTYTQRLVSGGFGLVFTLSSLVWADLTADFDISADAKGGEHVEVSIAGVLDDQSTTVVFDVVPLDGSGSAIRGLGQGLPPADDAPGIWEAWIDGGFDTQLGVVPLKASVKRQLLDSDIVEGRVRLRIRYQSRNDAGAAGQRNLFSGAIFQATIS